MESELREKIVCQEHSSVGIWLEAQRAHLPGSGQSSRVDLDQASTLNQGRKVLVFLSNDSGEENEK